MILRRFFSVLLIATAVLAHAAIDWLPGLKIGGDRSETNATETVFIGNTHLTYEDVLLLADELHYNYTTQVVVARGNVSLTRGTQRLLADEITYHLTARSYSVKGLRLGDSPLYVSGSGLVGDTSAVTIHDAQLFYSEPGPWTPSLRADSLTYTPGKMVRADNARLGFGAFKFLPLPTFNQSVKDPLFELLSIRVGYRSSLGAFADVGLLAPVAPDLKLGGDLGFYSNRGLLYGPEASYKVDEPGLSVADRLRTGFINDYGSRLTDILGRPIRPNRGFVEWDHHEQIGDQVTITGELNYWSDSEVLRDFRPADFFPVQTPDSFLEATYAGQNVILSAFVRADPTNFVDVEQRLPEVRADLLPTAMGAGFYERGSASVAVLREAPPVTGPTLNSDRADAVYEVSRPFRARDWFAFTPVAGGRVTYYDQALGGRSDYTRVLGEVGADAELQASATYDYKNAIWGIDGLRHLVTPTLSYRYIPAAASGTPFIPAIDRQVYSTYLQPLDLADQRNIDQLTNTNILRLGVDNTLQTRDPKYGSRDLATLNLAADWLLSRKPGQRAFSTVQSEFAVMPANWLRLDVFSRIDPQTGGLREFNTSLKLHDGNAWSVTVGTNYLQGQLSEDALEGRYRLNEVYEALARVYYDEHQHRFVENSYGLSQNLGNVWRVRYLMSFYQGPRREGSFGFNIEIELAKF